MNLRPLKLVTIIAEEVLKERLVHKVLELGASGCSYHATEGTGARSTRHDSVFTENAQLKIVCSESVAQAIMQYLDSQLFDQYAVIAWMTDVSVLNGDKYA